MQVHRKNSKGRTDSFHYRISPCDRPIGKLKQRLSFQLATVVVQYSILPGLS